MDVTKKKLNVDVLTAQQSLLQEYTADLQSEYGRKNCFGVVRQMFKEGRDDIRMYCMKNDVGSTVSDEDCMKDMWRYLGEVRN